MASDFVIQTLLQEAPRSLRPIFAHWLPASHFPRRKEEQIIAYLRALQDAACRARILAHLPQPARALLAHCVANETRLPAGPIIARTSAYGFDVSPTTLGELHYSGVAFLDSSRYWPGNANWSLEHAQQHIVVPAAIVADAPPCQRRPLRLPLCHAQLSENAEGVSARIAALIHDTLQTVSDGMVRLTQHNTLAVRTQRALAALWAHHGSPTAPAPAAVIDYLRAAGIVQQESTGTLVPSASFARERERPAHDLVAAFLDFLFNQCTMRTQGLDAFGFDPLAYAADTLPSLLLPLDPGTAIRCEECAQLLHTRALAMTRTPTGRRHWSWPTSSQPTPAFSDWSHALRHVADTLFLPLGVLAYCHHCPHGPCFALTRFGHFWLHGKNAPAHHHEHQQLIVQPDFTAVLTHTGPWDRTAHVLRIFGTHHGDHNATIFRFTRERVQNAVRSGHNIEELLALLDARASYPVPENVRVTLREWGTLSAQATLHRDANLLEFDTTAARDAFTQQNQTAARALGDRYALLSLPHSQALDVMQQLGALPVDYAQPPVAGLSILPDGSVTSPAPHDLRIAALRDAIATPVPPTPERPLPRWRISRQRLLACPEPALLFHQLMRLPGSPLPLPIRLHLLVLLRLVPRAPNDRYLVIDTLPQASWAKLKHRVPWRSCISYDGSPYLAVVAPEARHTVRAACEALDILPHDVSLNPPPFAIAD